MAQVRRRDFLVGCAGVAAGVAAGAIIPAAAITWSDVTRGATESPLAAGSGVLVLVTLYGGNDGINTLVPYTDNAYHDARPDLAYTPHEVLDLDGQYGLNPGMPGMAKMFHDKTLAIVRGVGYPQPDHSHFRSMDIWQSASTDNQVSTGWIGRWLDSTGDDPLRAINIGTVLPTLAIGERATASALSPQAIPPEGSQSLIAALSMPDSQDTPAMAMVRESYRATSTTVGSFAPLFGGDGDTGTGGNPLTAQLDSVARCVKAGVPARVYCVSLGGFDTHADERGTQQSLLKSLDAALTPFLKDMAGDKRGRDVVVMAYSEFGRRVAANASDGTDHGTAGPVFLAGVPVRGGFYGDEPSLKDLDDGDLKTTTDFRDIYNEVLVHTLGADPTPVVGAGRQEIGFLKA
jgi:uncharacterized protein (DUF1501 family)